MWNCTRRSGTVGLIIPSSFLNQHEFWKTRKFLVDTTFIYRVCNLGNGVFEKVTAPSCIITFSKNMSQMIPLYLDLRMNERSNLSLDLLKENNSQDATKIGRDSESYQLQLHDGIQIIIKCNRWPKLKEIAEDVATGISSGLDAAFVHKPDSIQKLNLESELLRKLVIGGEINRYFLNPTSGKHIIYTNSDTQIKKYPNCLKILQEYRERLNKRVETASGTIPWFSLYRPRRKKLFENSKILIRQTSDRILAVYDPDGWHCLKSAIIVQLKVENQLKYEYLLGILNSKLINYIYNDLVGEQARIFPEVKPVQLFKLPIRTINFADPADKARHDRMVALVTQMLALNKKLQDASLDHEKELLARQVEAADASIDKLVYELYGLTEEEIAVVEGGAK
jgi:hypothetical protein